MQLLVKLLHKIVSISRERSVPIYLLCVLGIGLLFQCKDEDNPPIAPADIEVSISADETRILLPWEENSVEVDITASGPDWTVQEEIAWLEAIKIDNTKLQVSYEKNEGAVRSGIVRATIGDKSVEITVAQVAGPYLTLGTSNYILPYQANASLRVTLDITFLRSSHQWHLVTPEDATLPDWLNEVAPSVHQVSSIDNKTATFNIKENFSIEDRSVLFNLEVADAANTFLSTSHLMITQSKSSFTLATEYQSQEITISSHAAAIDLALITHFFSNVDHWYVEKKKYACRTLADSNSSFTISGRFDKYFDKEHTIYRQ